MVNLGLSSQLLEDLLARAAGREAAHTPMEPPANKEPTPPKPGTLSVAALAKYKEERAVWKRDDGQETAESSFQNMTVFILNRLGDPYAKQTGDLPADAGINRHDD